MSQIWRLQELHPLFATSDIHIIQPKIADRQFLHRSKINSDFRYLLQHRDMALQLEGLIRHKLFQQNTQIVIL